MSLSIYHPDLSDREWGKSLRSMLHPDLWLSVGPERPQPAAYQSAHPSHKLESVVMSPHRAGGSRQRMHRRLQALSELLNAAARGEPIPNKVDIALGY